MKVRVDRERCQGHGRCYTIAPQLFEPDEVGDSRVIGDGSVPEPLERLAERAVANCPEHAISIEEED